MSEDLMVGEPLTSPQLVREFILAGKAKFTLKSRRTGKHFTYKVHKSHSGTVWFVSRRSSDDYPYLGTIFSDDSFRTTRGTAEEDAKSEQCVAFKWFWGKLTSENSMPPNVEFFLAGTCGMCGKELTDPISLVEGYGPECGKRRLSHSAFYTTKAS